MDEDLRTILRQQEELNRLEAVMKCTKQEVTRLCTQLTTANLESQNYRA